MRGEKGSKEESFKGSLRGSEEASSTVKRRKRGANLLQDPLVAPSSSQPCHPEADAQIMGDMLAVGSAGSPLPLSALSSLMASSRIDPLALLPPEALTVLHTKVHTLGVKGEDIVDTSQLPKQRVILQQKVVPQVMDMAGPTGEVADALETAHSGGGRLSWMDALLEVHCPTSPSALAVAKR